MPYADVAGHQTVGFGHLIRPGENFSEGLTPTAAEDLLKSDASRAAAQMSALVKVPLTQGQFDALTDFTFNLGSGALAGSTLLRLLNLSAYDRIPDELRKWVYAGGKQQPGLMVRREAEIALWKGEA